MMYVQPLPRDTEIASDGHYCWVNVGGLMLARFGPNGHEVHDHVVGGRTDAASWSTWTAEVRERLELAVGDEHRPHAAGGEARHDAPTEIDRLRDELGLARPLVDPIPVVVERPWLGRVIRRLLGAR
jgi:hypothetical protein